MDKKPSRIKRIWTVIIKAVRENGDLNERRNAARAKQGSYGTRRPF
ncbi:hypothetical protein ABLG96_11780 [Nakamurella sp. A5-74]|uniref:Uncharacterized protein n=1 Tax=Nakamurella sp. A5-74 TaxID=3158264 RepID=A0AAU8DIE5_9ACTN